MGVLDVKGPIRPSFGGGADGRWLNCEYVVRMSNAEIKPLELQLHAKIPRRFYPYPTEPSFLLDEWEFTSDRATPNAVTMKCKFKDNIKGDEAGNSASPQWEENPVKRPVAISGTTHKITKPISKDLDEKVVMTTAGEPLILEETYSYRLWSFKKFVTSVNAELAGLTVLDWINDKPFKIEGITYDRHMLWLTDVNFGPLEWFQRKIRFREITGNIYVNPETWIRTVMNVGYYQKTAKLIRGKWTWVLEPIQVGTPPRPISSPVPLNEKGQAYTVTDEYGKVQILGSRTDNATIGFDSVLWDKQKLKFRTFANGDFKKLLNF